MISTRFVRPAVAAGVVAGVGAVNKHGVASGNNKGKYHYSKGRDYRYKIHK